MNAKDWNGFTPDNEPSRDTREDLASRSADYQLGYQQAILDVTYQLAKQAHDQLAEALAKLERRPAA